MSYSGPYFPTERLVEMDYDRPVVMDSEPGAFGGPTTPETVYRPKPDSAPQKKEGGFVKTVTDIANALTPLVRAAVAFKFGYEGTPLPMPGYGNRRMASQRLMFELLENQQQRSDEMMRQARQDKIDSQEREEFNSLIQNAIRSGDLTPAQGAEALKTRAFPDLTKPIAPLEDFDYSAYGQPGFGLEDLKAGLEKGYSLEQLKEVARKAPEGRIGPGARKVFGFPETGLPSNGSSHLF